MGFSEKLKKLIMKILRYIKRMFSKTPKRKFYYGRYYKHCKVKENVILAESFHGGTVSDSTLALVREIIKSYPGKYKIYYGTDNKKAHQKFIEDIGLDVELIDVTTFKYTKILATAKYLINNSSFPVYFVKRPEQVYIQTWHGTPLKTLGKKMRLGIESMYNVQHNFLQADYITFPNDFTRDVMMEDYNLNDLYTGKVVMAGYPRNEIFFRKEEGQELKKKLGLEGKTVYAYMPTWRGTSNHDVNSSAYESRVKEIFKRLDKKLKDNQVFYVNFHPILRDSISLKKYKHIKPFPQGVDNYAFLNCADALVTDYSSVFFDYSITQKPIILFMYDYDEYMHDRGMYMDVASLPFRKIYDDKELAKVLSDESFMNDSYTDTEYFKTFFKYDSPDVSKRLLNLIFTGDESGFEIKDYSFNKEKQLKVIHPQTVNQFAHLNSIAKNADENTVVCFEKKWFKGEVGPALYDNFNDAFKYVVVTMTTPRTYLEDLLCHLGVKSVKEKVHRREIQRTFPNLNIVPEYIETISAYDDNCVVDEEDIVHIKTKKVSNGNKEITVSLDAKGYDFEKLAIVGAKRVVLKTLPLSDEEKKSQSVNIPLQKLIEEMTVYNKCRYIIGIVAVNKKSKKRCLIIPSISRKSQSDISKAYKKPLFDTYTLPKAYFDADLKKLIDNDNDRNRQRLAQYDLTPTEYEIASSPFYNNANELCIYFGKKAESLEAIYPPCTLKSLKTRKNNLTMVINVPKDDDAKFKGIVLKYRSLIEDIQIPLNCNIKDKGDYLKVTASIDFTEDMPMKEIYWDLRAVTEKYGEDQLVKIGYNGIALKQKLYFTNTQSDVGSSHIIFPYFNKRGIINFCYREKSEYDTAAVKRKEIFAYILYILFGLFLRRKNIWIVYEKFCKMAQDNGYYFFKYCMDSLPKEENKNIYYIIDKRSPDYENIKKYKKNVIQFMSVRHMLYILSMKICISSDSKSHLYAWRTKPSLIKRGIGKKKELFLQHGVTALKQVHQLFGKKGTSAMTYFVTTGRVEQEIAVSELLYNEKTAPITGFARWDVLENKEDEKDRFILLMPTWRSWLEEVSDEEFINSDYFKKYSSLMKNKRLDEILKAGNTRLVFYIHPKFAGYIDNFKESVSDRITCIPMGQEPLNELMMKCSMLITDYSSVCWDVYYLDKPVLFYQFDYDMYKVAHGSYINMETDLFGNRSTDENALLDDIEHFVQNGFEENETDRANAPMYFEYRDNNNSKRIYDFLKNNNF
ncbi:MAG: CDP-glycerol glycerophosphotransferase family protein [Eubacteriales bacterium]|nr:CDP-glycerol glycerophosphotransferase family protein [Eubacteriales bacterium]